MEELPPGFVKDWSCDCSLYSSSLSNKSESLLRFERLEKATELGPLGDGDTLP